MRITLNLRESMRILIAGEPCTLTFWSEGRVHKYEGHCYKDVAYFPLLSYSTSVPANYWITRHRRAA